MKEIYFSFSTLATANDCQRKAMHRAQPKVYPPFKRGAAMVVGKAVHEAIDALHKEPDHDPGAAFMTAFDFQESVSKVPVDFGEKGRDKHVSDGLDIVKSYWAINAPDLPGALKVISTERWFFVPITLRDGQVVWIRGKFDSLVDDDGELVIYENKSGAKAPSPESLERNPQCLLEGYALRYGYVAVSDDVPYIGIEDDNYHIHDFEPKPGEAGIFNCKRCGLETRQFGVYPKKIVYYHLRNLIPYSDTRKAGWEIFEVEDQDETATFPCPNSCGETFDIHHGGDWRGYQYDKPGWECSNCKTRVERRERKTRSKKPELQGLTDWLYKIEADAPRANPEYEIEFDDQSIDNLMEWLRDSIERYMVAMETGIWPKSYQTGWNAPCVNCEYLNHCEDMRLCAVRHNQDMVYDPLMGEWVTQQELSVRIAQRGAPIDSDDVT